MNRSDVMHEVLNLTGAVYWIMRPYHKRKVLDDQHWAYLCSCLKRIEEACKTYCEGETHENCPNDVTGNPAPGRLCVK
jgi:hypothetical protein